MIDLPNNSQTGIVCYSYPVLQCSVLLIPPSHLFAYFLGTTACPTDWYLYDDYCYYPSTTSGTYGAAYWSCRRMGANLASIDDQDEMEFVLKISYGPTLIIVTSHFSGPGRAVGPVCMFVCPCVCLSSNC